MGWVCSGVQDVQVLFNVGRAAAPAGEGAQRRDPEDREQEISLRQLHARTRLRLLPLARAMADDQVRAPSKGSKGGPGRRKVVSSLRPRTGNCT